MLLQNKTRSFANFHFSTVHRNLTANSYGPEKPEELQEIHRSQRMPWVWPGPQPGRDTGFQASEDQPWPRPAPPLPALLPQS